MQPEATHTAAVERLHRLRPPFAVGNWTRDQATVLPELYDLVSDAAEVCITEGITGAMNQFNGRSVE